MTLNGLHIRNFEARIGKGHLCRRYGRCRHEARLDPRETVRDDLNLHPGICAHLFCSVAGGNDETAVPIRRKCLGAEAVDASRLYDSAALPSPSAVVGVTPSSSSTSLVCFLPTFTSAGNM